MSQKFYSPENQEEMTFEEARAWVMVYHPNMSPRKREILIFKLCNKEVNRENHALAIEACLLNFDNCIDQLRAVEAAIAKMRSKTRKKIGKKFSPRTKAIAKKGKVHRKTYWNENAKPIMEAMEVRLNTLQSQLQETSSVFTDLAQDAHTQMIQIMEKRTPIETASYRANVHPIVETWKTLTTKLHDLLQLGSNVLPAIQNEINLIHAQLRASIAATI